MTGSTVLAYQQVVDELRRRLHRYEAVTMGGRVVNAKHAVELAQIERQDAERSW